MRLPRVTVAAVLEVVVTAVVAQEVVAMAQAAQEVAVTAQEVQAAQEVVAEVRAAQTRLSLDAWTRPRLITILLRRAKLALSVPTRRLSASLQLTPLQSFAEGETASHGDLRMT
jgi:hypothetical protein